MYYSGTPSASKQAPRILTGSCVGNYRLDSTLHPETSSIFLYSHESMKSVLINLKALNLILPYHNPSDTYRMTNGVENKATSEPIDLKSVMSLMVKNVGFEWV